MTNRKVVVLRGGEDILKHDGDLVEVDLYRNKLEFLLRKKIKGHIKLGIACRNEEEFVLWALMDPRTNATWFFKTPKTGHTIKELLDKYTRGPEEKKILAGEWLSASGIRIIECYCGKKTAFTSGK